MKSLTAWSWPFTFATAYPDWLESFYMLLHAVFMHHWSGAAITHGPWLIGIIVVFGIVSSMYIDFD